MEDIGQHGEDEERGQEAAGHGMPTGLVAAEAVVVPLRILNNLVACDEGRSSQGHGDGLVECENKVADDIVAAAESGGHRDNHRLHNIFAMNSVLFWKRRSWSRSKFLHGPSVPRNISEKAARVSLT
jgi:hypothetical protein